MRVLRFCPAILPLLFATACKPAPPVADPPTVAQPPAPELPPSTPETATANFRCGDLLVGARFDNAAGRVTLSINARRTQLPQALAASGARYADDQGNEFWNKGDGATLTLDGARHECRVTDQVSPWDEARGRGVVFRGLGTEPFWAMEVDGGPAPAMRLDLDMGERKLVVSQVAPLAQGEGWSGTADDGSDVTLAVSLMSFMRRRGSSSVRS